ncbi:hypothetical protein BCR41DRAFT_383972 [Lobosporangium transversale]|uniref:Uncharacterized protein n=1 Tax=Lobosporangium transversale TaxID=64571 RepID=A0A1Y2GYS2_9FUNG|nr:hypothetical protein BCR41DRAFT_383972 [Lobosporangium transversale]ORZ26911.1 hypothetical protein BCR41DRAFT_383972 [Lobosporangium transversale]|eukprot:XP_021884658.1 hypothetical protein BCR41DRAFT_383972 [Lobosporangium transversale]
MFSESHDAQEKLADAIVIGTSSALENAIPPILESVGKRVLAKTNSSDSNSSLSTCSVDSTHIARRLFVRDSTTEMENPFITRETKTNTHDDEAQEETEYEYTNQGDTIYGNDDDNDDLEDAIPEEIEVPSSHPPLRRVISLDGIDISDPFNQCHSKIASMETLKVAEHADELLLLNDILIIHDDKEQGPIITESSLASFLAQYKRTHDELESTIDLQHLNHEQQGKLISIAMELIGLAQDRRAASVVFSQYRIGQDAFNICLEMLFQFSCHLEKFPTSPRTEATFVAHSVMAMLSPIQNDLRQHIIYDQVSKAVKRKRPDIRLIYNKKEVLFGEVTSPERASDRRKVSIDLVRLGRFMKGAINNGVPKVIGIHVQGNIARYYRMELKGPGLYVMMQYGTFHLPQQFNQLAQVILHFGTIMQTQMILNDVKAKIEQPPSPMFIEWIRPQMDTPSLRNYF